MAEFRKTSLGTSEIRYHNKAASPDGSQADRQAKKSLTAQLSLIIFFANAFELLLNRQSVWHLAGSLLPLPRAAPSQPPSGWLSALTGCPWWWCVAVQRTPSSRFHAFAIDAATAVWMQPSYLGLPGVLFFGQNMCTYYYFWLIVVLFPVRAIMVTLVVVELLLALRRTAKP